MGILRPVVIALLVVSLVSLTTAQQTDVRGAEA